ncbi:MAG TPA: dipeptidase [Chloroflexota bacterium]|nr:dipeptidase [Chloroflexota bacterium]
MNDVIFDGHNDVLLRLKEPREFFDSRGEGHLDLPRAREGGFGGGFMACFAPSPGERTESPKPVEREAARDSVLTLMARLFRLVDESEGQVRVVEDVADIERSLADGTFAALLHIEGAEAIDSEFELLEVFYRAGLRSIGPVWSRSNIFGHGVPFGAGSPDTGPGLTPLGKELVRACNRLGIMIDLSHLNERGFWDVARLSDAPLVASHSNAHSLCATTRNLTDRQLDAIAESDGMVGVNFAVQFLDPNHETGETPAEAIADHIDYLVNRIGIDRVGLGSDFDGATIPKDVGDVAGLPRLRTVLRERGYGDAEMARLTHRNWLRVLRRTWGG